jgi:cytoskeletal protein CcmA (bactofilin family)
MAQIIKHRRGSINQIASVTANVGEFVIGTGSLGDLTAPVVFVGESAVAGGYNPVSKIYQGTNAPDLTVGTWGSAINGLPFYSTANQTLYILRHTGNLAIDLTGNIEGNVISGVTINNLTGTTINTTAVTSSTFTGSFIGDGSGLTSIPASAVTGLELNRIAEGSVTASVSTAGGLQVNSDIYATGSISGSNIIASGDISGSNLYLSGDAKIDGNITLEGNIFIGDNPLDVIVFGGEVSSSIIPEVNNAFDLGSPTQAWQDLYVSGTAYIQNLALEGIQVNSISLPGNLVVSGTTTLSGSVVIEDNTTMNGNLTVTGSSNLSGGLNVTGSTVFNGGVTITGLTDNRVVIVGTGGILEDDSNFTFDGTTLKVGNGNFEVDVNDGDIRTSGSLLVDTLNVDNNLNVGGAVTVTGTTSLLGNLFVSGNVEILGSASYVYISSSVVEIDDNIIRLNAYSPFERYAGFEVIDSGSSDVSASMLWDSLNDYWLLISSSGQSSKMIGTTAGTYGSEISLTTNTIPKSTGPSTIGNSLLTDNETTLAYNTNKFTVTASDGATLIAGNLTLSSAGGSDAGNNTSGILFKNSTNVIGYVSTTETTDVLDGILGYKQTDGALVFSTVIDGGTY